MTINGEEPNHCGRPRTQDLHEHGWRGGHCSEVMEIGVVAGGYGKLKADIKGFF